MKVSSTIRIDEDLKGWLKTQAKSQSRSYSNLVNNLLSQIKNGVINPTQTTEIAITFTDVR